MNQEEQLKEKKESLLQIKGQKITNADYRGLISVGLLGMFAYALFLGNQTASIVLGPFVGVVVGYYFHDKASSRKSSEEI
ncbi:MAG: hypothetical protein ACYC9R_12195 [Nitrosotalea sp.]